MIGVQAFLKPILVLMSVNCKPPKLLTKAMKRLIKIVLAIVILWLVIDAANEVNEVLKH
jgi:hypothetical protein